MKARNRGFTLIEVTVALLIAGLSVLVAHQIYSVAGDASARLGTARHILDRRMNARRWLQETFLSLEVSSGEGNGFAGHPDRVSFTSRLRGPYGWSELRRIEIRGEQGRLVAAVTGEDPIVLEERLGELELDYLMVPGEATRWAPTWISPTSAPLAVRLRMSYPADASGSVRRDTTLLLIKERG